MIRLSTVNTKTFSRVTALTCANNILVVGSRVQVKSVKKKLVVNPLPAAQFFDIDTVPSAEKSNSSGKSTLIYPLAGIRVSKFKVNVYVVTA